MGGCREKMYVGKEGIVAELKPHSRTLYRSHLKLKEKLKLSKQFRTTEKIAEVYKSGSFGGVDGVWGVV